MAISGAALGPLLDSYHSSFGVLQYDAPIRAVLWGTAEHPALTTSWWVPELFALAGIIIGWLYVALDAFVLSRGSDDEPIPIDRSPSPPKILTGIALFTFQYWLSGALFASGAVSRTEILATMSTLAAVGFAALDGSLPGLASSAATAAGGPLIEAGLIGLSRLGMLGGSGYHYSDTGETGFFPIWIAPVYFLGGPAVGNLARGVWSALSSTPMNLEPNQAKLSSKRTPGCQTCADT
jgi:hypothetical protein